MYYMHGGRIYAPRNKNGKIVYDLMAVRRGADEALCIVKTGGGAKALPSGALPMTESEVLARIPAEPPQNDDTQEEADVS